MSSNWLFHPEWLAPLLGIGVAALLGVLIASAYARRRARRLVGRTLEPAWRHDALPLLALLAVGIALLGPRLGERGVRVPAGGGDVVLLLDVSRSMDARDVPPSRMQRARTASQEILAQLGAGDRVALAAFAEHAVLITPLTRDHVALAEQLPALDTDLMRPSGSQLAAGIQAAVNAFDPGSERARTILVLSDGEDANGRDDLGITTARQADARVVAVALGGDAGVPIGDADDPLRDARGKPVKTRRDLARLDRLVAATGGQRFTTDRFGGVDATAIANALRPRASAVQGEPIVRRVPAAHSVAFALLAFGLLALERLPRWTLRRAATATAGVALLGLGVGANEPRPANLAAELENRLRQNPQDPESLLELGWVRAQTGDLEEAGRAFLAAAIQAREPHLASLAYYDYGVVALELGQLERARDAFFEALAHSPHDAQARFNLEWTLRALTQTPPPRAQTEASQNPDAEPQETAPEPDPTPHESPTPASMSRGEPLSAAEAERWLAQTREDPSHALRGLRPPTSSKRGAAW